MISGLNSCITKDTAQAISGCVKFRECLNLPSSRHDESGLVGLGGDM
jgi:hypothetical protein